MKNIIRVSLNGNTKGQQFLRSVLKACVANAAAARGTAKKAA